MTKIPPGPKEILSRQRREAEKKRSKLAPYAGKPVGRESETSYGNKYGGRKKKA